ncbi:RNA polymerase sigma-70 factor [Hoyosella sp. G463]|uniref:RNA polymerase sigma-70 factor n=1 Tax=Lolliginicoccus lacisalsi TaxID=2742202 RepID=A0A927JCD0_9ACTN|nr:RNA polymerase sigma-70 factor [Lolliginicoccus lacisalsi]MBD8506575.1 RNA polymerase sigma-70 factor [Lolliginicoccus lacisalsi]
MPDLTTVFEEHRGLLFTIAYEILGSAADAEDAVQDTYLSWMRIDGEDVADPRAYLARAVSRRAIDVLRAARRKREEYIGPWLPEPVATSPDIGDDAELAESVSMAMMLMLETLGPVERAVLVMRDVFDFPYSEISTALGRSEPAIRQIAHRARTRVQAGKPRFAPDPREAGTLAARFLLAARGNDIAGLIGMLAPDAVAMSDGGGVVSAARRPVHGAERVARFLAGLARKGGDEVEVELGVFNALPGVVVREDGQITVIMLIEAAAAEGPVTAVYLVRNPGKLARAQLPPRISR